MVFPKHPEHLQRSFRVPIPVRKGFRPDILIKSQDRRSITSQNQPHPPASNDFRVRKMRQDLGNRPFSRRRPALHVLPAQLFDQLLQLLRGTFLDSQGILALDVSLNPLEVLLRRFLHRQNRSSSCHGVRVSFDSGRGCPPPAYFCATFSAEVSKISVNTCPRICLGCSIP